MQPGISTLVFLPQRLTPAHLDSLADAGAQAIEIFAARHHFDYTDRGAVLEIANWFRSSNVAASLHMPVYAAADAAQWSRHTAASLNLIDTNKGARIDAMDEVKRALESAELVPFRTSTLHLGLRDDQWDTRALDDSLTAIEHLKAFASPLGIKLLMENLTNQVATPEHLLEILRVGHFDSVGVCFDVAHAHLTGQPLAEAFEILHPRIGQLQLSDNHGPDGGHGDEHLWPGAGTLDWDALHALTAQLPPTTPAIVEASASQAASITTLRTLPILQ